MTLKVFELFKTFKLQNQLITIFLLNTLIPIFLIAFLSYYYSENIFFKQTINNLNNIIDREEREINLFFEDKKNEVQKLSQVSSELLHEIFTSKEEERLKDKLKEFRLITETLGYSNIFIFSDDDKPLYVTTNYKPENLNKEISFFYDKATKKLHSFITFPILKDGVRLGILSLEIEPENLKEWFQSANKYSSLGKTGEFLFGILQNDELILIIPPRNGYKSTDKFTLLEEAILGITSDGITTDFRGNKVIGVTKKLGNLDGGIEIKMDYQEFIQPLYMMKFMFFAVSLAAAGLIILIAPNFALYIVRPIKALIAKTQKIASGNLSQRIDITSNNELGLLGKAFNDMAEKVEALINHLDERVEIRTKELRESLEDLKLTQERLIAQEKLASLGAMTAGVAHEIKNPLNFVNNFSTLTVDLLPTIENFINRKQSDIQPEDTEEVLASVETMKQNLIQICVQGKRADNIIKRMLAHSRSQTGTFTETDINSLVQETVNLAFHTMRAQHPKYNVKITYDMDPTIEKISVVSEDINRVILNLINNSFYSVIDKKEKNNLFEPKIMICTKKIKNSIEIKIWDNGLGISEDKKQNIFTPFFTTKPTGEGTGLGLSLSFNIITQEHGGKLEFNSVEGEYAEFIVTLPLKEKS